MSMSTSADTQSIDSVIDSLLVEYNENSVLAFEDGVACVFDTWQTLQIAVDNQMAGQSTSELYDEFIQQTINIFTVDNINSTIYPDEISDWLYDTLSDTFHITADDNSCEHIAQLLCTMYTDCTVKHDYTGLIKLIKRSNTMIQQLLEMKQSVQSNASTSGSDDNDDDNDDNGISNTTKGLTMSEYSAQLNGGSTVSADNNTTDEDGWTTVSKNKKYH